MNVNISLTSPFSLYISSFQLKRHTQKQQRWALYACCGNIFGIAAFFLTLIASFRCNIIKFLNTDGTHSRDFGLWWYGHYEVTRSIGSSIERILYEGCTKYPDFYEVDAMWSAARAFNALALIGGLLWVVIDSCNQCVRGRGDKPDPLWMSYLLLLTCLFSGLTLLVLDSNLCKNNDLLTLDDGLDGMYEFIGPCTISGGAKNIILATVFWFMAGIGSLMAYRSKMEYDESARSPIEESLLNPNADDTRV